jgi:hypothetical protein
MGLAIGVRPKSVIDVADEPLTIIATEESYIDVEYQNQKYRVTEHEQIEICPSVFLGMGKPKAKHGEAFNEWDLLPRLLFEAPRHISIQRRKKSHGYANTKDR